MDFLELAKNLRKILEDKKAEDIVIFDVRGLTNLTEFFIFATANSDVHARALADYLAEKYPPHHIEGKEYGRWIVLDYGGVIVHIMLKDVRDYYGLEWLWSDAKRL
jgi:ribosome-associated protein